MTNHRFNRQPVAIVTTSWDDGHPMDLRVAERLASYGLLGTFYVALNFPHGPDLQPEQIRRLRQMGMEIGSHTLTHRYLTGRPHDEVVHELRRSKEMLEEILGEPIAALSYPEGAYNRTVRAAVTETGYRLARTTIAFRTDRRFDPCRMPVSLLFRPLSTFAHVRHATRDGNVKGLIDWCRVARLETDLVGLAELMFDQVLERGGVFHLCARSGELDEYRLWGPLEKILRRIAQRDGVLYLTNSQVLQARSQCESGNGTSTSPR